MEKELAANYNTLPPEPSRNEQLVILTLGTYWPARVGLLNT
jgi:hypothetical protein